MLADPVREEHEKLEEHLSPVLYTACPFAGDIDRHEIEHLDERLITWENALAFGHLAELPVIALDHIGGVDQLAKLGGILEEGGEFVPVRAPGTDDERIFGSPCFFEAIQLQTS
ncbi:hypothetical protein D3C81_781670 [compost metagenome]